MSFRHRLEHYFEFKKLGTNWRTEILAGLTTFITMAYIGFVNPSILHEAGLPVAAATAATCVSAAAGSLLMGAFARCPVALAPGMGLNAYFTYVVVKGLGIPWQAALGAVFVSGVVFLVLAERRNGHRGRIALHLRTVHRPGRGSDSERGDGSCSDRGGLRDDGRGARNRLAGPEASIPAFLTMLTIPLTFSIANGLTFGFIVFAVLKVLRGKWRQVNWLVYVLAGLFLPGLYGWERDEGPRPFHSPFSSASVVDEIGRARIAFVCDGLTRSDRCGGRRKVTDLLTHAPLAGVTVTFQVSLEEQKGESYPATTDASGSFRIVNVQPGE